MDIDVDKILAVNIFRYVVSFITVIGNGFLLFLFCKYPILRQSQCNLLVLLLNMCDLLIGKYIVYYYTVNTRFNVIYIK